VDDPVRELLIIARECKVQVRSARPAMRSLEDVFLEAMS